MRAIEKEVLIRNNYYKSNKYYIRKTCFDNIDKKGLKEITQNNRLDYAFRIIIHMVAYDSIDCNKNILKQIQYNENNQDIYELISKKCLDKTCYEISIPKWEIVVLLNKIKPENDKEFVEKIISLASERINEFIPKVKQ